MKKILAILFLFLSVNLYGQISQKDTVNIEDDIIFAYKNSVRGVLWAIDNYPYKKEVTYKDLIIDNRKICSLRIYNQEGGIKIISTGYHNSTSVEITTYKSFPENRR
ncbi:MAG: hypothetical protein WHV63_12050 [Ignavibacteria bacterium]|jgi:hypothetical protein|nr:hypothetical protein [Ignavibacteria bacterium]MDH7527500.1 hypothetical protein [Ignavibacteria bacterium]